MKDEWNGMGVKEKAMWRVIKKCVLLWLMVAALDFLRCGGLNFGAHELHHPKSSIDLMF